MAEIIDGNTIDIVKENLKKLQEIYPEAFTEGKVDPQKLLLLLGEDVDSSNEKYSFTWKGKNDCIRLAQSPSKGTLLPCKEESVDWDTTKNLYIEGDNLEVLKLLQKSYLGKIKMIYIDPPYNTGSDFVYEDDFSDNIENYKKITGQTHKSNAESEGKYHTKWLNMIYPRLKIARTLLSNDGVIFISIDDNEVENLKKVCDEIFGSSNYCGTFIVNSTPNARDYGHIGKMHEYCLFYCKNSEQATTNMLPELDKKFKYSDSIGGFNIHPLYNSNEAFHNLNRPNLYYPFYVYPDEVQIINGDKFFNIGLEKKANSIEIYPPKSLKNGVQFVWRWGKEKALKYLNQEIIGYKVDDNEYRIVQKMRHSEKIIRSLLLDTKYSSRRGTAEVEELLEGKIFSFPKPLSLLNDFIKVGLMENDIVLDFFSGAATTAHSVMQVNAEDGGNRKFIMVQLPEVCDEDSEAGKAGYKNICEIGKERIRRAGKLIKEQNSNVDTGFRVFKLDTSNLVKWNNTPTDDPNEVAKRINESLFYLQPDRTDEDFVYEIMLKLGMSLSNNVEIFTIDDKKVYGVKDGAYSILICLEYYVNFDLVEKLAESEYEVLIFADRCFADANMLINTEEILKKKGKTLKLF